MHDFLEIAEGRKEICKLMRCSWRTIQRKRLSNPVFRRLFMENPSNGKPSVIIGEYNEFAIEYNRILKRKQGKKLK